MNQTSLELWKKRINDRKSSGLNVSDWCERNNLTKHAYYYWKKRIEITDQDGTSINNTPLFAELKTSSKQVEKIQEVL